MYSDYRQRHISVAALRPGDTLEYRTVTHIVKPPAAGNFWYEHTFPKGVVVSEDRLEIDVPKARELKLETPKRAPEIQETGAAQHVGHEADALARHLHADRLVLAGRLVRLALAFGEREAVPVVTGRQAGALLLAAHRLEALRRAETLESINIVEQHVDVGTIDRAGRFAGTGRAGRRWGPVSGDAQPAQRFENHLLRLGVAAHAVGVFHRRTNLPPCFLANR